MPYTPKFISERAWLIFVVYLIVDSFFSSSPSSSCSLLVIVFCWLFAMIPSSMFVRSVIVVVAGFAFKKEKKNNILNKFFLPWNDSAKMAMHPALLSINWLPKDMRDEMSRLSVSIFTSANKTIGYHKFSVYITKRAKISVSLIDWPLW